MAAAAAAEDTAPGEGLSVSTKRTGLAGCPPHHLVAVVTWHVGSMFREGGLSNANSLTRMDLLILATNMT